MLNGYFFTYNLTPPPPRYDPFAASSLFLSLRHTCTLFYLHPTFVPCTKWQHSWMSSVAVSSFSHSVDIEDRCAPTHASDATQSLFVFIALSNICYVMYPYSLLCLERVTVRTFNNCQITFGELFVYRLARWCNICISSKGSILLNWNSSF